MRLHESVLPSILYRNIIRRRCSTLAGVRNWSLFFLCFSSSLKQFTCRSEPQIELYTNVWSRARSQWIRYFTTRQRIHPKHCDDDGGNNNNGDDDDSVKRNAKQRNVETLQSSLSHPRHIDECGSQQPAWQHWALLFRTFHSSRVWVDEERRRIFICFRFKRVSSTKIHKRTTVFELLVAQTKIKK